MLIYFYRLFLLPFSQILDLMLTLVLQYTVDEAYDFALFFYIHSIDKLHTRV